MRVRIAVAGGLVAIVIAGALILSGSPLIPIASNAVALKPAGYIDAKTDSCQEHETVPAGTTAVRISLFANVGPRVSLTIASGSHVVAQGSRAAGWGISETVTIPVPRVARTVADATVCTAVGPVIEPLPVIGSLEQTGTRDGRPVYAARFHVEYLRPGPSSWWSMASSMARRMGLGHAPSGTWVVLLIVGLMASAAALALWMLIAVPTLGAPARRAACACAAIACLSAVCWSLITPPFQAPDEPSHFAYAMQLAVAGKLPRPQASKTSAEEGVVLDDLHEPEVRLHPERHTISSRAQQQLLQSDLTKPLDRHGEGGAGVATAQPPLYYALQTIPYRLGSSGTLLDQLELMRLLSALMAGLTALFAYLFVREILPGSPWAWVVGGLAVALTPLLGFMSGVVNPDAMLYAVSAAVLYVLARGFRRGLTPRLALALGVLSAVGTLTKLNFVGLLPGILVGLLILGFRAARLSRRTALLSLGLALGAAVAPAGLYMIVNLLSHHPALGLLSTGLRKTGQHGHLASELSYIWQLYLPRLPGMTNYFPGISSTRQIWFDRYVGLYGWLDTSFPTWVTNAALIPAALIAALSLRELVGRRGALRRRGAELGTYLLICTGILVLVGSDSYLVELTHQAGEYTEPRYLLPMLPLLGALYALAARGAGRRWGPPVGALIVLLLLGHDIFSQLQVIARYYG